MIENQHHTPWAEIPQDWVSGPIFPVEAKANQQITINGNTWTFGVVPPSDRLKGITSPQIAGLNIVHAEVICGLLSFIDKSKAKKIKFSMNRLALTIYGNSAKPYFDKITNALSDLLYCWMSVDNGEQRAYFRILSEVCQIEKSSRKKVSDKQLEFWFDSAELSSHFINFINEMNPQLFNINNEGLQHFKSNSLAKAIFMYLPSRLKAGGYNQQKRFKIGLIKLFEQMNYTKTGLNKFKSKRKEVMTRGKESVMFLLDGAKIDNNGSKLRVILEDNNEGSDYNLVAWMEFDLQNLPLIQEAKHPSSKTEEFVRGLGYSKVEWEQLNKKANQYNWPEYFKFEKWGLDKHPTLNWQFKIYCQLIGEWRFAEILAAESDGEAQAGAMILKFRQWALTNNKKNKK